MGTGNLKNFLQMNDAQVVAVCDVHDLHYRDMPAGEEAPWDESRPNSSSKHITPKE